MNAFNQWLTQVSQWLWGPVLLTFLLAAGVYLTVLLRGVQFRYFGHAFKLLFSSRKGSGEGDVSPFQSLATALGGAIGTGNIAGVALAISIGGVGAIFWMWVSGLLGMAIQYAESTLAVRFRVKNKQGEMAGGPMYTIEQGLGWKWLALLFALFGLLASFGIGNLVQAHSIGHLLQTTFGFTPWITGIVLAVIVALVVVGGIRWVGRVSEVVVPAMAAFYILGGIVVIVMNYAHIPAAIGTIFSSAFTGQAATGGFVGASATMALRLGLSRGLFSNEAGLGSGGIAAAAAATDSPGRQGLIAMLGPFFDTVIVCSVTGLALAVTGVVGTIGGDGRLLTGAPLTAFAFGTSFPGGGLVVTIALLLFAFSAILAWAYYGEKCLEYLIGSWCRFPYRLLFVCVTFVATLISLESVWNYADIANGLMAIPNLVSLLGLSTVLMAERRLYREQLG